MQRRDFLKTLIGSSSQLGLPANNKTLVTIFLRGGADTLNMLVPMGDDDYYNYRSKLAIARPPKTGPCAECAIPIDDFYGFHPFMHDLLPIYRSGRLAFIQGVGTDNEKGSHFSAQEQVERGASYHQALHNGWLTRHLQTQSSRVISPMTSVAIGTLIPESLHGASGVTVTQNINELELQTHRDHPEKLAATLGALYAAAGGDISTYGLGALDSINHASKITSQHYKPENAAEYPDTLLARGLREIASLVKAEVGMRVATINHDGWDTHNLQGTTDFGGFPKQLKEFAYGLAAFDRDLAPVRDQVTILVMTEFGRRSYLNSAYGTDHGRGCAYMVIDNDVRGGMVHGDWLGLGEKEVEGPSGLHVQFDYRSVLTEILRDSMGNQNTGLIFPDFTAQQIDLFGNRNKTI